ncbi:D-aminopeptidase [Desulfonema ishimotonii]|uniref:D-aminopeptidase n=2 Tax=Desulfonema ishimotonii TaxID=45657 RepID=A0A401FUY4_9BACT|nr:D-aminopeptidase [Desulfonema ishimotonii]
MGKGWRDACVGMTRDVSAVVTALSDAGVRDITVKDFHRTGYNLLPEHIDSRARVVSGYKRGPVPGLGDPGNAQAVIFLGMHAASGSAGAFLPHTLTSRIARLEVNGRLMPELALFSAALAPYHLPPVLFSGCPVACDQAAETVPGILTWPIDKSADPERFDAETWRTGLADAAVRSLQNRAVRPWCPDGPFEAVITMRDGVSVARKLSRRWGFGCRGEKIFITAADMAALYSELIRLCYLTPVIEKIIPLSLGLSNLRGKFGLGWIRRGAG